MKVIIIVAIVTWICRLLPFLIFNEKSSLKLEGLSKLLPAAIMAALIVYSLRGVEFTIFPSNLYEIICILFAFLLHYFKKNTILSILLPTILYMILIRL